MGIAFGSLIEAKQIELDFLRHKVVVIDGYNILYQFLTTIRGQDGSLLTDQNGVVTSHLVGLFSRTTNLMQRNIKIAYVFDGTPPLLKQKTIEARMRIKKEAEQKLVEATEQQDIEGMKKYSARTARLTKDMVAQAKHMLDLLGIPVIQAPSEGEAQASYMVKKGDAYCVGSQDFDSLVNGANRLVRNLSVVGKRKQGQFGQVSVEPELIELAAVLNSLGIDADQLIALAILVGTDYNPGGIKGIGPMNALKLVKRYGRNFEMLFSEAKWDDTFEFSWKEVYETIKNIPITDDYQLEWKPIQKSELELYLVGERSFSSDRVSSTLERLQKETAQKSQRSLADF